MANFSIEPFPNAVVIRCGAHLNEDNLLDSVNTLIDCYNQMANNQIQQSIVILDLINKAQFDEIFLREATSVLQKFKQLGKKVLAINVPKESQRILKNSGMDSAIKIIESEERIQSILNPPLKQSAGKVSRPDVEFINPFVEGTIHTLKVQCSVVCTAGKLFLKNTSQNGVHCDIAGIIGLTSAAFNGSIAICFPKETFLSIMSKMLGETYQEITKDLEDGAGELMNIIFGHAKKILNEKGYGIDKAIPTIVKGQSLEVRHMTPNPTMVLPFTTDAGAFQLEVGLGSE